MSSMDSFEQPIFKQLDIELDEKIVQFEDSRAALHERLNELKVEDVVASQAALDEETQELADDTVKAFGSLVTRTLEQGDRQSAIIAIVDTWYKDGMERMEILNKLPGRDIVAEFTRADIAKMIEGLLGGEVAADATTAGTCLKSVYGFALRGSLLEYSCRLGDDAARLQHKQRPHIIAVDGFLLNAMAEVWAKRNLHGEVPDWSVN